MPRSSNESVSIARRPNSVTMYYVGKRIVPLAFNKIAGVSRELLNLFILVFIFAVIALSSTFGVRSLSVPS